MNALEAREVTCAYGNHEVLHRLSLAAEAGQVLALLGPNGVGKTTLLKALARLMRPKRGAVLFQGRDVWRESAMQSARHTAVTPQNEMCDWPLTVEETVLLGRAPHRGWLAPFRADDRKIASEAMRRLQLEPIRQRPVTQLSGGEWRRVLLARALAQEPQALLLDEPTAQLDLRHQVEILTHVKNLSHGHKLIVVVTLHDLNQAAQHADRLALLGPEGLVAIGRPEEVLKAEILSSVYGVAVEVVRHPVYSVPLVVPVGLNAE